MTCCDAVMFAADALAREQMRRNAAAVEEACEAALQGGRHGVRVVRHSDGTVTAQVHPDVPYGTIHEYPGGLGRPRDTDAQS